MRVKKSAELLVACKFVQSLLNCRRHLSRLTEDDTDDCNTVGGDTCTEYSATEKDDNTGQCLLSNNVFLNVITKINVYYLS